MGRLLLLHACTAWCRSLQATCISVSAAVHHLQFTDSVPLPHKKNIWKLKLRPVLQSTSCLPALITAGHFLYRTPFIWISLINSRNYNQILLGYSFNSQYFEHVNLKFTKNYSLCLSAHGPKSHYTMYSKAWTTVSAIFLCQGMKNLWGGTVKKKIAYDRLIGSCTEKDFSWSKKK